MTAALQELRRLQQVGYAQENGFFHVPGIIVTHDIMRQVMYCHVTVCTRDIKDARMAQQSKQVFQNLFRLKINLQQYIKAFKSVAESLHCAPIIALSLSCCCMMTMSLKAFNNIIKSHWSLLAGP